MRERYIFEYGSCAVHTAAARALQALVPMKTQDMGKSWSLTNAKACRANSILLALQREIGSLVILKNYLIKTVRVGYRKECSR